MTQLGRQIQFLEKKIKLIQENYAYISQIGDDMAKKDISLGNLLFEYNKQLEKLNKERAKEVKQIDIEDSIKEIKNEKHNKNIGNI